MKKTLTILLALALTCGSFVFTSCGESANGEKISVVCTVFPIYDWVTNIVGTDNDKVEVTLLMENGSDLHNYQPSAKDIVTISDSDLFIYVGGESDGWVADTLAVAENPNIKTLALLESATAVEEEAVEGMQTEEHGEEEHDEEEHDEEEHGEETEYDEHIWLSLSRAGVICDAISEQICELDSANSDTYRANTASYKAELASLDAQYKEFAESITQKTIVVCDRFPFRYLAEDYGFEYFAAFIGCSAETEASFETVVFLANKVDELGLSSVFIIDGSDGKIASTVIENTAAKNATVNTLNSMQSTKKTDIEAGTTYLSIAKSNLDVLKSAMH